MTGNLYWRLFNFFGKLFGGGLIAVGCVLEFSFILQLLNENSKFNMQYDVIQRIFLLVFPQVLVFLGWLMLRAKPFYPKI